MSVQPTQHMGSQPIRQNPHQAMPNPRTYGQMAFGTPGVQPDSTYRIAPTTNRLQKNMYGTGYSVHRLQWCWCSPKSWIWWCYWDACWRTRESRRQCWSRDAENDRCASKSIRSKA
jgi:hypothetical protein